MRYHVISQTPLSLGTCIRCHEVSTSLAPNSVVLVQPDIYHSQFPRSLSWSLQEEWTGNETADKQRCVILCRPDYLFVCIHIGATREFLPAVYIYNQIVALKWKFNRTAACYSFFDCLVTSWSGAQRGRAHTVKFVMSNYIQFESFFYHFYKSPPLLLNMLI